MVVGGCTLIAFALYENYLAKNVDQLLPTHLFSAPGYISMVILSAVGTVTAYSGQVFWPQEVHAIIKGSPERLALLSSVIGSTCLLGFFIGGFIFRYCTWHRTILIGSAGILAAFCGAMISVQPGDDKKGPALIAFVMLPIGTIEVGSRALLPLTCPDEDIGAALGALGSIGYACASVGIAVYSAVLTNKVKSVALPEIAAAAVKAGLPESSIPELLAGFPSNLASVPGITKQIMAAVAVAGAQGYADAFRYVWYCALAFALCAFAASFFTINYEKYLTDNVARKLQYGTPPRVDPEATEK
ncbi:hypothetical protein H2204_000403 [Knufia peltigerae]|uniref:Uncharacterized protein n=1 Tax=Knufia peltigerae TaxID=1002370 RepID=A0AA39D3D8_9EURO|nr:hypothetical protein H2204_000403 [Knufia peltigerae]